MEGNEILKNDLFEAFSVASDHVYIYVCDIKTNLSRWSPNAVDYFEMPGEYMEDVSPIWIQRIHPDDRQKYQEDIERVFSGKSRRHKCEYRAMNRYGDYVWLECRGTMIYDQENRRKVFAGIMTRLDARNKYDPLTNLKTFYEFNNHDFHQGSGSILLIGIDDFREVTNNFGYSYGDTVLADFSKRILDLCTDGREAYRLEGDEFLLLSPGAGTEDTERLFQELRIAANGLGGSRGRLINLKFSGGAVLYPQDGVRRDYLISNMEHSIEHAKKYARGKLVFFSKDIAKMHNHTIELKQALTRSMEDGFQDFELYYQPLVTRKDHRIGSCEALLRWEKQKELNVSTQDMVRLLEESGEIKKMGCWVAEKVFADAQWWQKEFPELTVSFNVSALQFQGMDFVEFLINKARKWNIRPEKITIELTESSKVEDLNSMAINFKRLRDFGFKTALDDFGIAYSTLLLVRNLPTDYVKIDHSFILNLTKDNVVDLAIIEAVISLCKKLNIQVVAEGIENKQILSIMEQYPVSMFQGYYFEKPLPRDGFVKLLKGPVRQAVLK